MSLQMEHAENHFLFRILSETGIEMIFGSRTEEITDCSVPYFQLKHEKAVHAADGYARTTGKPSVVVLPTASGITNGITGVATAYSDSVPLIVIAGPVFSKTGNFQELDISGMMVPITKRIFW